MNAIRITQKIDSDTLHLPALKPFIGKTVEIIVLEESGADLQAGTGDWNAARQAAQALRDSGYDFDALRLQREYDLKHAHDHLP